MLDFEKASKVYVDKYIWEKLKKAITLIYQGKVNLEVLRSSGEFIEQSVCLLKNLLLVVLNNPRDFDLFDSDQYMKLKKKGKLE